MSGIFFLKKCVPSSLLLILIPHVYATPSTLFLSSSCRVFTVLSKNFLMFRFCSLACCRSLFYLWFKSEFPPWFWLSVCDLQKEPRFLHSLILLLYIFNRLTLWCRLSGYLSISRSLSWFRFWLSSYIASLREGYVVFFSNMILLMVSALVFFPLGSLFAFFVFAEYGSLSCSVWFGVSGSREFSVSVVAFGVCWCVAYICVGWFPVF